jgi:growth hormone-inducible transmembrane protein
MLRKTFQSVSQRTLFSSGACGASARRELVSHLRSDRTAQLLARRNFSSSKIQNAASKRGAKQTPSSKATPAAVSLGLGATRSVGLVTLGIGTVGVGAMYAYGMTSAASREFQASYIQERMRAMYGYVAAGLGLTAAGATYLFRSGLAARATSTPWIIGAVLASIAGMILTRSIPKEQVLAKHAAWGAFLAPQAFMLAPLAMLGGPIVLRAAAATVAMLGSLTLVASAAPPETFRAMTGPVTIGFGLIMGASLVSLFLPGSTMLQNFVIYGGLAFFGVKTVHDTQVVAMRAEQMPEWDPINESISFYLDFINVFIRMVYILSGQKKK